MLVYWYYCFPIILVLLSLLTVNYLFVYRTEAVADAFMQLVNNEAYNGAVLEVIYQKGTRQVKYPGEKLVQV